MSRADHDPAGAAADLQPIEEEVAKYEHARDEAEALVYRLEREADEAYAAGDKAEVDRLVALHHQAEQDLAAIETDLNSTLEWLDNSRTYWYLEDDEDEEDDDD